MMEWLGVEQEMARGFCEGSGLHHRTFAVEVVADLCPKGFAQSLAGFCFCMSGIKPASDHA
jgi:hypothetical protein